VRWTLIAGQLNCRCRCRLRPNVVHSVQTKSISSFATFAAAAASSSSSSAFSERRQESVHSGYKGSQFLAVNLSCISSFMHII